MKSSALYYLIIAAATAGLLYLAFRGEDLGAATSCPDAQFDNANYNSGTITNATLPINAPTIECYAVHERTKNGGEKPAAATDTLSDDECDHLEQLAAGLGAGGGDTVASQKAYDTAKAFLTLCYNYQYPDNISVFSTAGGDNDQRSIDPIRYDEFREWLKTVLYLRTDTEWYCADVYQIAKTFIHYPGHGTYYNAMEAIDRYILEHNRCDSEWSAMFARGLIWPEVIIHQWQDTVQDSLTEPRPDTTVPSIDSIGLSILRGPQYAGIKETLPPPGTQEISGLTATENPFTNTTAIKFNLADYGLVTFQLYDLLGHAVTTNGIGQVLYPGAHEFDIDGSKLAPGTYIARVAFHDGDVKSIMVVKK